MLIVEMVVFDWCRWERLGDIVILPATSFIDPSWDTIGEELWSRIVEVLGCRRLARQVR